MRDELTEALGYPFFARSSWHRSSIDQLFHPGETFVVVEEMVEPLDREASLELAELLLSSSRPSS